MLIKILGWIWLLMGVLFLSNPGWLRERLQKKSIKKVKRFLFSVAISFGFFFIMAGLTSGGLLSKVVIIFGVISICKAAFFLKAKASEAILIWIRRQPLYFFRICALLYIIFGIFFIFMSD